MRIISHSIVLTETSGWIAVWYLSSHGNFCIYLRMAVCMVFILKWEFLYFLRMAVWYLSSHGNFYIFSGWLSGIYCLMGIFIFISRWLSGIYLHICLNLSPGGCLVFIFSWEYVYLYLDGCVIFLYFKTDNF